MKKTGFIVKTNTHMFLKNISFGPFYGSPTWSENVNDSHVFSTEKLAKNKVNDVLWRHSKYETDRHKIGDEILIEILPVVLRVAVVK